MSLSHPVIVIQHNSLCTKRISTTVTFQGMTIFYNISTIAIPQLYCFLAAHSVGIVWFLFKNKMSYIPHCLWNPIYHTIYHSSQFWNIFRGMPNIFKPRVKIGVLFLFSFLYVPVLNINIYTCVLILSHMCSICVFSSC